MVYLKDPDKFMRLLNSQNDEREQDGDPTKELFRFKGIVSLYGIEIVVLITWFFIIKSPWMTVLPEDNEIMKNAESFLDTGFMSLRLYRHYNYL